MGFFLEAFLGGEKALREWRRHLPATAVCLLSGDLALVPVTRALYAELRARLGEQEAARLDAAQRHPTWPSPSFVAAVRHWGSEASHAAPVAHLSTGEFGDQGHEEVTVWAGGREVLSRVDLGAAIAYFRSEAGLRIDESEVNVERHRGEEAAEKWAAEALRAAGSGGSAIPGATSTGSTRSEGGEAESGESGASTVRPPRGVLWGRRGGTPSGCLLTSCLAGVGIAFAIWSAV